jgi:1-acyl-sn-glycerol-3-phosphate acyltransferase
VSGLDRIPLSGGLIVASNHISFWDPPLIGSILPREVSFLAKEELFRQPGLGQLIRSLNAIPIRRGVADLTGMARAMEALKAGNALLMFPEGSRMRDGELHPARPGVGMLAVNADVPVLPCCISGSNRPSRWWYRGARVRIVFGAAKPWRELVGSEVDLTPGRALYQSVADGAMREIAALKAGQQTSASYGAAQAGRTPSR